MALYFIYYFIFIYLFVFFMYLYYIKQQYQEKWLQHIQRMDTNRIPKQAVQYKSKGRRHIGRLRKRWTDQFHFEDTRDRNQT